MHFHWSQIAREMRLGMVMMMITANNARSPRILAAYQDRLPDEELHLSVSSPFKVSARHHFLQLQRTADENMPHKKQSSSIHPRLLSLISIIILISAPQTLASQISEQLCQVLTLVAVARNLRAFPFAARAVPRLPGHETRGAQGPVTSCWEGMGVTGWICLLPVGTGTLPEHFAKGFFREFAEGTCPSRAPLGRGLCASCQTERKQIHGDVGGFPVAGSAT